MVELLDDNSPDSSTKQTDVAEKEFEMEDIDPDLFAKKMAQLEAQGKTVDKNEDGSYTIPKFELN